MEEREFTAEVERRLREQGTELPTDAAQKVILHLKKACFGIVDIQGLKMPIHYMAAGTKGAGAFRIDGTTVTYWRPDRSYGDMEHPLYFIWDADGKSFAVGGDGELESVN